MCYPPDAFKIKLKCHVIHFHGNNIINIVRLWNSIECFTHKALALKQQEMHHPLCYFKADPCLNTPERENIRNTWHYFLSVSLLLLAVVVRMRQITSASAKITQSALEFSPVRFGEYFFNFSQIKLKVTFTRNPMKSNFVTPLFFRLILPFVNSDVWVSDNFIVDNSWKPREKL